MSEAMAVAERAALLLEYYRGREELYDLAYRQEGSKESKCGASSRSHDATETVRRDG